MLAYLITDNDALLYGDCCGPVTVQANTPEDALRIAKEQPDRFTRGVTGALNPRVWIATWGHLGWMAKHKDWK